VIVSKDSDFVDLIAKHGTPPKLILLRCGNTTNRRLREIFSPHLESAISKLSAGDSIVEIF